MSYNGSGTFALTNGVNHGATVFEQDAAAGVNVVADRMDVCLQDIANGLTKAYCKDGQSTPTANLPMGTFKFTGLGAGSARTDSVNLGQIQDGAVLWGGASGGATPAYTISLTPPITAYVDGMTIQFGADKDSAGNDTLNVNGVGAKRIAVTTGAEYIGALDIKQYAVATVVWDAANDIWRLLNPQRLDRKGTPIFASITAATGTFSGTVTMGDAVVNGLTASRYVSTDAAKKLASGTSAQVADDVLPQATLTTTWTTVYTPSGSMTYGSAGSVFQRYCRVGKMVFLDWHITGVVGGTHADDETITVTVPVKTPDITAGAIHTIPCIIYMGANYPGVLTITNNSDAGVIRLMAPTSGRRFVDGTVYIFVNGHYLGV